MKKLLVVAASLVFSGLICSTSFALSSSSYTSSATFGMFEETYDYFQYSPAYMPSFKNNTFWSQFANKISAPATGDRLFNNSVGSYDYFIGAQADAMGMGRAGLLFQNAIASTADNAQAYGESGTHTGLGENTYNDYRDRNSDGVLDYRKETYGRSEATYHGNYGNVYAAYALGEVEGFDLGLGLRAIWNQSTPTYTQLPYSASGGFLSVYTGSFNLEGRERQYDLVTGQELYRYDESTKGSLNFGNSNWKIILGGRSKDLLPDMDLVVNLVPVFQTYNNALKWDYSQNTNYAPSDPATLSDIQQTYKLTGVDTYWTSTRPGGGFGVNADVRSDYTVAPNLLVTGQVNVQTLSTQTKDAQKAYDRWKQTRSPYWTGTQFVNTMTTENENKTWNYDGKGGTLYLNAALRAQYLAKGWRLALGCAAATNNSTNEETQAYATNLRMRYESGDGIANNSYTTVTTESYKTKVTTQNITNTYSFPTALVFDVLKNLQFQVGANHVITTTSNTSSTEVTERALYTSTTTRDDGSVTSTVVPPVGALQEANRTSTLTSNHATQFAYGITWWPYEQIQVDFTYFSQVLNLENYRIGISVYF